MSFKTLMSNLLDCFVPKSGGGALGNVYGVRASFLSLSSMSEGVAGTFDGTSEYVVPFDALVVISSISSSTNDAIRITVNGSTFLRTVVVTSETSPLFVPKGAIINKAGGATINSITAYPLAQ